MAATVQLADVEVGTELPSLRVRLQRVNLVMYAGASGDFNPIHWNERVATSVGLPDVISHGMFTMASAVRVVTETRRASISGVQRRLKIGYNRAARLIEAMEAAGIVSGPEHNGDRTVIAPPPPR